jgi:hypothetical protein
MLVTANDPAQFGAQFVRGDAELAAGINETYRDLARSDTIHSIKNRPIAGRPGSQAHSLGTKRIYANNGGRHQSQSLTFSMAFRNA